LGSATVKAEATRAVNRVILMNCILICFSD
jgi:hypothetical protein